MLILGRRARVQRSSTVSPAGSHLAAHTRPGSAESHAHQLVVITSGEHEMNSTRASCSEDAFWPNISAASGQPSVEAHHLPSAGTVIYPYPVLEGRGNALGWNVGSSAWPRSLDAHASIQILSTTEGQYPLAPTTARESALPPSLQNDAAALLRPRKDPWHQEKCQEALDLDGYGTEYHNPGQAFPMHDEHIVDLRFPVSQLETHLPHAETASGRPLSGSSFSISSSGPPTGGIPHIEEPSVALVSSKQPFPGYTSRPPMDPSPSGMNLLHLPGQVPQQERTSAGSRGRASSSPRRNLRSAPYPLDNDRANRWSTGSFAQSPIQHSHSPIYQSTDGYPHLAPRSSSVQPTSPPYSGYSQPLSYQQAHDRSFLPTQPLSFQRPHTILPPPVVSTDHREPVNPPPPLLSHGLYRMPPRSGEATMHGRCHGMDLSDPPDLFGSLQAEQIQPPPEDLNPLDPDLVPHEQDLRFEGDLYTPRWVRGQGNKREGWCGICKPGRWLVLKNSAFWYDKSFSHGISAANGTPFQGPQANRRLDGNPDIWEGYCGSCNDWIALVSSKKKGTTWFRHAYKV